MAAKPRDVVVRFVSDVRGFLRGTDQVEHALDAQVRDLDHVGDEGEQTGRRLAKAYDKAGDAIKRRNARTARETRQTIGDAGKDAGDEFAQNLGESLSSGDVSGLLSGTIGGLVGTFGKGGPLALALGALGAVGVGVFTSMQQSAEKAAEAAQAAFDQLHDNTTREAKLNAVLADSYGGTVKGWEEIQRLSEASGLSVEAIADALADGGSKARTLADHWNDIARDAYQTTGDLGGAALIMSNGADVLNHRAEAMERAASAAKTERDALAVSEGILRRSAKFYAERGSAYAPGGSTYNSQVPRYATGKRG